MSEKLELLPILLNGKSYTFDPSGNMAINTDGKAIPLADSGGEGRFR